MVCVLTFVRGNDGAHDARTMKKEDSASEPLRAGIMAAAKMVLLSETRLGILLKGNKYAVSDKGRAEGRKGKRD